jgi:hypothetical protein
MFRELIIALSYDPVWKHHDPIVVATGKFNTARIAEILK